MSVLALYRRLLRQARPYWLHLAGLFGIGLLASPLALLDPVPLKIVFDSVLGSHPLPVFVRAVLPSAVVGCAAGVLVAGRRLSRVGARSPPPAAPDRLFQACVWGRVGVARRPAIGEPGPRSPLL